VRCLRVYTANDQSMFNIILSFLDVIFDRSVTVVCSWRLERSVVDSSLFVHRIHGYLDMSTDSVVCDVIQGVHAYKNKNQTSTCRVQS